MSGNFFSVIETFEDDKQMFSSCPSSWISGEYVLWPPKSQLYKSRKDYAAPRPTWKNYRIVRIIAENIGNKTKIYFILNIDSNFFLQQKQLMQQFA